MSIDPLRKSDEIRNGELFGTLRKKGVHVTAEIAEGGPQSIAQHLAALPERCLDDLDKEEFVTIEMRNVVTCQPDHGTPTVKRYSMSYHACSSTDRIPYSFDPGAEAMRCATSR